MHPQIRFETRRTIVLRSRPRNLPNAQTSRLRNFFAAALQIKGDDMTNDQKKKLAVDTLLAMLRLDRAAAEPHVTPDMKFIVAKSFNLPPDMLDSSKKFFDVAFTFMKQLFPNGLKDEIERVLCDGDTVVILMRRSGIALNDKPYDNDYCIVCEFEGDKIKTLREYSDSIQQHRLSSP